MKQMPNPAGGQDVPTRREIRDACRQIQDRWSDRERRRRAGLPKVQYWIPPIIPVNQLGCEGEFELEP